MDGEGNALFACEYVMEKEKYIAWGKENAGTPMRLGFTVSWCVFAAITFVVAICCELYVLLPFCVLALYRGLLHWRILTARQYSLLAKRYGTENWVRKISFGEDHIVTAEGNISMNTSFSELTGIEEKGNYIKLRLKNGIAIRLYSDCFVTGTWEECRAFLLQHISCGVHYDFY